MSVERIASLLASGTEIVFGLSLGDRLVAVSHECDHPPEAASRPRVTFANVNSAATSRQIDDQVRAMCERGEPLYGIDAEVLVELRPEVIVTQAQCDVCAVRYEDVLAMVAREPELCASQVVPLNPTRLEHVFNDIEKVAAACGATEAGKRYVAALRERVEAVAERIRANDSSASRVRVACLEWLDPPMLAANWMPDLIEPAGGRCELTKAGAHSGYANWEDVRQFDPEAIVLMPCGFDLTRTLRESPTVERMPGWGDLTAVRTGRVFAVDGNAYFNRSGPRMVDSLELLAGILHPQLFAAERLRFAHAFKQIG